MKLGLLKSASKGRDDPGKSGLPVEHPVIAVMGVGNILMKDDGLGIHAAGEVTKRTDPARVEIIDAGTVPDIFTLVGEHIEKLIIIDAADANGEPGTIYRLGGNDIESGAAAPVSLHELGLSENLKILKLMNPKLTDVVLFGMQIADISPGLELSGKVSAKMPVLIEQVLEEIEKPDL